MKFRHISFLAMILCTANAFADVNSMSVSNEFPSDKLMLENTIYKNSAVFENLGVYEGEIIATAVYDYDSYHCDAGYYLPKDASECVICEKDSFCGGGDFAYNETEAQGIESCPENTNSIAGATSADECGKLLHVGEDVMYLTTKQQTHPAFAIQKDGITYYAKMSPAENGKKPLNKNTTRSMKVLYNNIEYYVYDNTVPE